MVGVLYGSQATLHRVEGEPETRAWALHFIVGRKRVTPLYGDDFPVALILKTEFRSSASLAIAQGILRATQSLAVRDSNCSLWPLSAK